MRDFTHMTLYNVLSDVWFFMCSTLDWCVYIESIPFLDTIQYKLYRYVIHYIKRNENLISNNFQQKKNKRANKKTDIYITLFASWFSLIKFRISSSLFLLRIV